MVRLPSKTTDVLTLQYIHTGSSCHVPPIPWPQFVNRPASETNLQLALRLIVGEAVPLLRRMTSKHEQRKLQYLSSYMKAIQSFIRQTKLRRN
jgi:hypothetical protein